MKEMKALQLWFRLIRQLNSAVRIWKNPACNVETFRHYLWVTRRLRRRLGH